MRASTTIAFAPRLPQPEPRDYRAVVLENEYLRIVILPELGGRIWRVIHKPSGNELFYHNAVVMPSPWGPTDMRGWFALGGLEWDLPVAEHGYDWGIPWQVTPLQNDPQTATVIIEAPHAGRKLAASIRVTLRAGAAAFTVEPSIRNVSSQPVRFAFWQSAALAPGHANRPSADLHFVVPGEAVTVHSTGDASLPGAGQRLAWPVYNGRDLSRLGNWTEYLGVFERPAAHGPFVAVYDRGQDAGGVRVFPETVARGSKVFGLGYQHPLDPDYYTVDGSSYVELHGGLAPTFDDQVTLAPGGELPGRRVGFLPRASATSKWPVKLARSIGNQGVKGCRSVFIRHGYLRARWWSRAAVRSWFGYPWQQHRPHHLQRSSIPIRCPADHSLSKSLRSQAPRCSWGIRQTLEFYAS